MRARVRSITFATALACLSTGDLLPATAADDTQSGSRIAVAADVPSMTDSAEAAFAKLDHGAKGYVTYEDVAALPDFASVFGNVDSSHLGRLNLAGFTLAWATYVKGKN